MRTATVSITTDASGAGTAQLRAPINGEILQVRAGGTAFGTANVTVTRTIDNYPVFVGKPGGTIFGPYEVPIDGYLKFTVAHGGATKTDKIRVFYEGD